MSKVLGAGIKSARYSTCNVIFEADRNILMASFLVHFRVRGTWMSPGIDSETPIQSRGWWVRLASQASPESSVFLCGDLWSRALELSKVYLNVGHYKNIRTRCFCTLWASGKHFGKTGLLRKLTFYSVQLLRKKDHYIQNSTFVSLLKRSGLGWQPPPSNAKDQG